MFTSCPCDSATLTPAQAGILEMENALLRQELNEAQAIEIQLKGQLAQVQKDTAAIVYNQAGTHTTVALLRQHGVRFVFAPYSIVIFSMAIVCTGHKQNMAIRFCCRPHFNLQSLRVEFCCQSPLASSIALIFLFGLTPLTLSMVCIAVVT